MNDATRYYVATIERAIREIGRTLETVTSVREVPAGADVLLIDCREAIKLRLLRPGSRYWLWVQGILPEEVRWHFRSRIKSALLTGIERATLPAARGLLMVSEAMRSHYAGKYGWPDLPVFVMPCVNQALDPDAFYAPGKYTRPSFVYAGSLHVWQCFELTLDVFRRVRSAIPEATLTVLTGDQGAARAAIDAARIEGATVGHVPLDALQATLRQHKYGFVLRDEHVVNAVATPTKVSGYMAAGVIPIMTTAVRDYVDRLGGLEHVVMSASRDPQALADRVLAMERREISPAAIAAEYRAAFDAYLSHDAYVAPLASFLRSTGLAAAPKLVPA